MLTNPFTESLRRRLGFTVKRLERLTYRVVIPVCSRENSSSSSLTPTQESFCLWNAERLGISIDESRRRFARSWSALPNGHRGVEYSFFANLSYRLYEVFSNDSESEVYQAYQNHALLHFLRELSYPEVSWPDEHPIVLGLAGMPRVTILDYGCGLAQSSRGLAKVLRNKNTIARLLLADIPTIRKGFLLWMGEREHIETECLECTQKQPIPELPPLDVCIGTEVFEHLHDPLSVFDAIHDALKPGGFLQASIDDHLPMFMHVSPGLSALRERVRSLGYETIVPSSLYRKPGGTIGRP